MFGPMVFLVALCFVNCNVWWAVAVLCLAGMVSGSCSPGYYCSFQVSSNTTHAAGHTSFTWNSLMNRITL